MAIIISGVTITPNPVSTNQYFILSVSVQETQTSYADLQGFTYEQLNSSGKTYLQLETATP